MAALSSTLRKYDDASCVVLVLVLVIVIELSIVFVLGASHLPGNGFVDHEEDYDYEPDYDDEHEHERCTSSYLRIRKLSMP